MKAKSNITIKLVYLEPLDVLFNKFWKFSLGNTFSERSLGSPNPNDNLIKACHPNMLSKSDKNAYPWFINIDIISPSEITFLESPTHPIDIKVLN